MLYFTVFSVNASADVLYFAIIYVSVSASADVLCFPEFHVNASSILYSPSQYDDFTRVSSGGGNYFSSWRIGPHRRHGPDKYLFSYWGAEIDRVIGLVCRGQSLLGTSKVLPVLH